MLKKRLFTACVALLFLACGGGGDPTQLASSDSLVPSALIAKAASAHTTLLAGAFSVVNTDTAGRQDFRGIGALANGGYTVGWSSGSANFIQRYDSVGIKSGSETFVAGTGTMAVLTTGDVVHACCGARFGPGDNAFLIGQPGHTAITAARFDANGNFLQQIEVVSIDQAINPSAPTFFMFFVEVKVVALADGGFVVGWVLVSPGKTAISDTLFTQRYDSQGQPVGGTVQVSPRISTPDGTTISYSLAADAQGGYTVSIAQPDFATPPNMSASVFHYDVNGTATQVVPLRPGAVFVLPLEGDRYVFFTSDSSGSFRQMLDSDGNPAGDPVPVSVLPFDARELADGSFVVFWNTAGNITAQRFDSTGTPLNDPIAIQTGGGVPGIAALADGGLALAWSAASTAGQLDVFTQQFIEVIGNGHAALRVKRKACLESAKGLVGQARKTFMDACLG